MEKLASGIEKKVARLASFKDPQHTTLALAMAGSWPRLEHAATLAALDQRRVPTHVIQVTENADRNALAQVLDEYGTALDDSGWRRARLPFRSGGLGIPDANIELDAAVARVDAIRQRAQPGHDPAARKAEVERLRSGAYNTALDGVVAALPQGTPRGEVLRDIVAAAPHLWLSQPATSTHGTLLSREAASPAIALFLGLEVLPAATQCFCRGPSTVDTYASHVAGCYNSLSARHNSVRGILAAAARRAVGAGNVWTEVDADTLGRPVKPADNGRRPGDVAFRMPENDRWNFIDVTVQSPIQTFLDARARGGAGSVASLADFGDNQKSRRNHADVTRLSNTHCSYSFFSLGAFGSLSRPAARTLSAIAHRLRVAAREKLQTDPATVLRWKIQAVLWSKMGANLHDIKRRSTADLTPRANADAWATNPPRTPNATPAAKQALRRQTRPPRTPASLRVERQHAPHIKPTSQPQPEAQRMTATTRSTPPSKRNFARS